MCRRLRSGGSRLPTQRPESADGDYALIASRLAPEKGIDVAIDACIAAGRPLVVAGDGPEREALQRRARRAPQGLIRFLGAVPGDALAQLRERAALALVPSRSDETFGLAAAEAMAAALPVLASSVGALGELLPPQALVPADEPAALAAAIERMWGDLQEGAANRARIAEILRPTGRRQSTGRGLSRGHGRVD